MTGQKVIQVTKTLHFYTSDKSFYHLHEEEGIMYPCYFAVRARDPNLYCSCPGCNTVFKLTAETGYTEAKPYLLEEVIKVCEEK